MQVNFRNLLNSQSNQYILQILKKSLIRSVSMTIIALITVLTLSLQSEDPNIKRVHNFAMDIIKFDNEFLLQHYFPPIHEEELKQGTICFFDRIRYDYQKEQPVDLHVLRLDKEMYTIEIGACSYSLFVYSNRRKLRIRSVMPLMKGSMIVGFVPANLKFKED